MSRGCIELNEEQIEVAVKRLPDTFIPKVFLYVQQMRLSTVLAIAFCDGSIEIRDRITMELVKRDNVNEKVSSLGQVGFEFPVDGPRKQGEHVMRLPGN